MAGKITHENLYRDRTDDEGNDVYPAPRSGMAERGHRVYVANGCVYCHSQQVRADYAASDIDRKWGERRSAPRDYTFDRPTQIGKMRMGPDLSNIGKRAPVQDENPAKPTSGASPAGAANPATSPAGAVASNAPARSAAAPPAAAAASPAANGAPVTAAASPVASPSSPKPDAASSPATPAAPGVVQPTGATAAQATTATPAAANPATNAAVSADVVTAPGGSPIPYSAPWHHRHLYSPRSLNHDSNMPSYAFLYRKQKVDGQIAADALKLTGDDAPAEGSEIVPTYDAKCLVAYLMSLDQSHPLKEVKSATPASPSAPAKGVK